MPHFGRLRLDTVDPARGFDAASADGTGAASRAFTILRAMLAAARQWGGLGPPVPDACTGIANVRESLTRTP